ncbi:MAG: sulfatase-like hydrolase/transferase, partial [Bacteroidales bacterium]|nr:sulfatase-like hydrolase/transferase [Bacteroidales bacterium]
DRASVMTGLYPHTHGSVSNNIPLAGTVKTLPEIIGDPDYHSAYMGKWHLGNEIFPQRGFATWVSIEDNYIRYYGKDRDREARSDYHHWLVEKGYEPNDQNRFSRSYAARLPFEHCKPKFLEEKAMAFLEKAGDDPFILYINFLEPHMPFFGPLDSLYSPDEVIMPENLNHMPGKDEPLTYQKKVRGDAKKYGNTEQEYRELRAKYWGLVTQVDISVGAILDKLDEMGLAENTIVVYTSDHGEMMGAHQMMAKGVMYEESVRIPFLLKDPRQDQSHRVIKERVSQIDIVPTVLDLMAIEIPENLQGKSLVPALRKEKFPAEDIFIEWNSREDYNTSADGITILANEDTEKSESSPSMRTVISKEGWKLALSNRDKSQLFNLNDDPLETTNLYYMEEHQQLIEELTRKIQEWQKLTNDSLRLPYSFPSGQAPR